MKVEENIIAFTGSVENMSDRGWCVARCHGLLQATVELAVVGTVGSTSGAPRTLSF